MGDFIQIGNDTISILSLCEETPGEHWLSILYITVFTLALTTFLSTILLTILLAIRARGKVLDKRSWLINLDLIGPDHQNLTRLYSVYPDPESRRPSNGSRLSSHTLSEEENYMERGMDEPGTVRSKNYKEHGDDAVNISINEPGLDERGTIRGRRFDNHHSLTRTESSDNAAFVLRLISNPDIYYDKLPQKQDVLKRKESRLPSIPDLMKRLSIPGYVKETESEEKEEATKKKYSRSHSLTVEEPVRKNSARLTLKDIQNLRDIVEGGSGPQDQERRAREKLREKMLKEEKRASMGGRATNREAVRSLSEAGLENRHKNSRRSAIVFSSEL